MKNFDNWDIKKQILDKKNSPNPKTRDIWWTYTGINETPLLKRVEGRDRNKDGIYT